MSLEERATLAGQVASHASMWLLAASLTEDRSEKREWLTRAFRSWSIAARHMSLLQGLAPNCAREGFEDAAKIADFVEGREG